MELGLEQMKRLKVEKTMSALKQNGINPYFAPDKKAAADMVMSMIEPGASVAFGGRHTIESLGILPQLRSGNYRLFDRKDASFSPEEKHRLEQESFTADYYLASTNAVTMAGELYNVDGSGNRVAALNFGPRKVILVVGVQKIVADLAEAEKRVRTYVSPAICMSYGKKTPCAITGVCVDCNSPERVCNLYSTIRKQRDRDRMHLIFVDEMLGF